MTLYLGYSKVAGKLVGVNYNKQPKILKQRLGGGNCFTNGIWHDHNFWTLGNFQDSAAIFIAPGSDIEEQIARVWRTCLMNEKIGLHDNFFDIGGNSLLLLQVFKGIQHLLPKDFALIDLFRFPTIGSLVRHLNAKQNATISVPTIIADRTFVKKAAAANQASRQRAAAGARQARRKTA